MTIFFIVVISILIILVCSSFKIDIQKFKIVNKKIEEIKIIVSIAFLNEINLFKITINQNKIEKIKNNEKAQELTRKIKEKLLKDYKNMKSIEFKDFKEYLRAIKYIQIENIKIKSTIGTESAPFAAFVVTLISLVITFLIARKVRDTKYNIQPIYINENYLNLSIKCIISIKLVHIISIIKMLKRKDRDKGNGRTSNRRAYANSNG